MLPTAAFETFLAASVIDASNNSNRTQFTQRLCVFTFVVGAMFSAQEETSSHIISQVFPEGCLETGKQTNTAELVYVGMRSATRCTQQHQLRHQIRMTRAAAMNCVRVGVKLVACLPSFTYDQHGPCARIALRVPSHLGTAQPF